MVIKSLTSGSGIVSGGLTIGSISSSDIWNSRSSTSLQYQAKLIPPAWLKSGSMEAEPFSDPYIKFNEKRNLMYDNQIFFCRESVKETGICYDTRLITERCLDLLLLKYKLYIVVLPVQTIFLNDFT